jgi:hypothetical protein
MAAVIETRLQQAQAERMAPIDLVSMLVSDEIGRRAGRDNQSSRPQLSWSRKRDARCVKIVAVASKTNDQCRNQLSS